MHYALIHQMKKTLHQIDTWLDAAGTFAKERSFDSKKFIDYRLAPDQFGLARQVQSSCDTAKLAASRLTGKEAPVHPDTETSLEELQTRIRSTVTYLEALSEKDFDGAGSRRITNPRWEGKSMTGHDYVLEHAVPNFYFHAAHAYAILRSCGVAVGKKDYLGPMTMKSAAEPSKG